DWFACAATKFRMHRREPRLFKSAIRNPNSAIGTSAFRNRHALAVARLSSLILRARCNKVRRAALSSPRQNSTGGLNASSLLTSPRRALTALHSHACAGRAARRQNPDGLRPRVVGARARTRSALRLALEERGVARVDEAALRPPASRRLGLRPRQRRVPARP